jgi:RNA polymerase sigma factor (sigma-70 family)
MANGQLHTVLRHLRRVVAIAGDSGPSDRVLLERFASRHEEAAFALLVERHGPLVLGVCRRLLRQEQDAEDAFQGTFLVLARKVRSLRWQESVGSWLYQVAYRVALKARSDAARRRRHERQAGEARTTRTGTEAGNPDLAALLDEEISRLPEKYRVPVVLCYLQGRSHTETASALGWPPGTVKGRLARARQLLRSRLARRGVTLSAGVGLMGLPSGTVPAALAVSTIQAAGRFADGLCASLGVESTRAAGLAEGILRTMLLTRCKLLTALLLTVCVFGAGVGILLHRALAAHSASSAGEAGAKPPTNQTERAKPVEARPVQVDRHGDPLPAGALARLGTVRFRHGGIVNSVAFSPDRKTLVSGGQDGVARIWDLATGKLLHRLPGYRGTRANNVWVESVAFSPGGKYLATGNGNGDSTIRLWDPATGKELRQFDGHRGNVSGLAFVAAGKRLVSAGSDGLVLLWEVATGKKLKTFDGQQGWIRAMALSHDSKTLATGGDDKAVHLFDVATGKEVRSWKGHPEMVVALAFSRDGRTLATGCWDRVIRLWEVKTGKEIRQCQGHYSPVSALAFFADGKTLASGSWDRTVRLWDVATGKELRQCEGHRGPVPAIALSADEKTLASGSWDETVRLWDVATGKEVRPTGGHQHAVTAAAFSPDGRVVATGGEDHTVRLWDVSTGRQLHQLRGPGVTLKNPRTGQESRHFQGPNGRADAIVFSPDGKTVTVACWDHTVYVWDVATGKHLRQFRRLPAGVRSAFTPDGKVLASAEFSKDVILWAVDTGKRLRSVSGGKVPPQGQVGPLPIGCVALSPDGKTVAAGFSRPNAKVLVWDVATGKQLHKCLGQHDYIPTLAFSPDGKTLASGGGDFSNVMMPVPIHLWDVASGQEIRQFRGHPDVVTGLAFSPDGKTLAAADGRTVFLWEVASGRPRGHFDGHWGTVWGVTFSPDGRSLASVSQDTTALIWDLTGLKRDGKLPALHLSTEQVQVLWTTLAQEDAARAYAALWQLVAAPRQAVPYLARQLRPVAAADPRRVSRLIGDLDSKQFPVRNRAGKELEQLGEVAGPALRAALAGKPSVETRQRLRQLLVRLATPSSRQLQQLRAVEVLEHLGTADAHEVLRKLALGAPGARLTQEAGAARKRLTRPRATKP